MARPVVLALFLAAGLERTYSMLRRPIILAALCLLFAWPGQAVRQPFDLIVRNARVVDGAGNPWYRADIGLRGGYIAAIGNLSGEAATRVIDAAGAVVAPGFIDLMGGSDLPILRDPLTADSKLRQGITTMLVGEGGSVAPRREAPPGAEPAGLPTWKTFREYFTIVEERGIPLNVVHNVGAAQVRELVLGDEDKAPTPEELEQMKALVEEAMKDGAVGLSSALIYPPGAYARTEELVELARVAARHRGVYFTHVRNESSGLLDALREAIRVGEEAAIPVEIYHLKAAGERNWPLMIRAIRLIQDARDRGVDITADIYPYIRNGIGLGSFIHPKHYAKGADAFLPTLSNPNVRQALRREIEKTTDWENWYQHVGSDWNKVLITGAREASDPSIIGLSVEQVAGKRHVDPWTAFFDLVQQGGVSVAPESMNEEQKREALRTPWVMLDCDSSPTNPATAASAHPRAFGTFPRVLAKYVREEKVISLEEAVRKMTSLPANRLGLFDRGRIALGAAADLVVFDPERVRDTATFARPLSHSEGIEYVIVSGQLVIDGGRRTGNLPGKILRHRAGGTGTGTTER